MKLFGYIKPFMDFSFSTPVYTDDRKYYFHSLYENLVIKSFFEFELDESITIIFKNDFHLNIGDYGLIVFIGENGTPTIDFSNKIAGIVDSNINLEVSRHKNLLAELNKIQDATSENLGNITVTNLVSGEPKVLTDRTLPFENRPSIFIGSSIEATVLVKEVKKYFEAEADVDIWSHDVFFGNEGITKTLLKRAAFYDYAIFIVTNDDVITSPEKYANFTHNFYFEMGFFYSILGLERTFFIMGDKVELNTNFPLIPVVHFDQNDNTRLSLIRSCLYIRKAMDMSKRRRGLPQTPSTVIATKYYQNFLEEAIAVISQADKLEIFEKERENRIIFKKSIEIKDQVPSITVLLPQKLLDLSPDRLQKWTSAYKKVIVSSNSRFDFKSRNLNLYMDGIQDNSKKFYDVPTSLIESSAAIKEIFHLDYLNNENIIAIERREILNFERAIRNLASYSVEHELVKFDILD